MAILAPLVLAAGLLLATGAFLFWASNGLPYQDASAEMLRLQQARALQLELAMLLGLAIALPCTATPGIEAAEFGLGQCVGG